MAYNPVATGYDSDQGRSYFTEADIGAAWDAAVAEFNAMPDGVGKYDLGKQLNQIAGSIVNPETGSIPGGSGNPAGDYVANIDSIAASDAQNGGQAWTQAMADYNAGKPVPSYFQPILDHLTGYYQQGQAAPGALTQNTVSGAFTQWKQDNKTSPFNSFLNTAVPSVILGGAGFLAGGSLGAMAGTKAASNLTKDDVATTDNPGSSTWGNIVGGGLGGYAGSSATIPNTTTPMPDPTNPSLDYAGGYTAIPPSNNLSVLAGADGSTVTTVPSSTPSTTTFDANGAAIGAAGGNTLANLASGTNTTSATPAGGNVTTPSTSWKNADGSVNWGAIDNWVTALPGSKTDALGAVNTIGGAVNANNNQDAANSANAGMADATNRATDLNSRIYDTNRADMMPWLTAGTNALSKQQGMLNDPNSYTEDPYIKWLTEQGTKGLTRSAASKGMLESGSTLAGLAKYNQGMAGQGFDQQYNRWAGLSKTGQSQANTLASLGTNFATNQNNLNTNQATNNANTTMYNSGQNANMVNNGLNTLAWMYGNKSV